MRYVRPTLLCLIPNLKKFARSGVAISFLALAACSNHSGAIRDACSVFEPIAYSVRDTAETQAAVEKFDVKYLRLCHG